MYWVRTYESLFNRQPLGYQQGRACAMVFPPTATMGNADQVRSLLRLFKPLARLAVLPRSSRFLVKNVDLVFEIGDYGLANEHSRIVTRISLAVMAYAHTSLAVEPRY